MIFRVTEPTVNIQHCLNCCIVKVTRVQTNTSFFEKCYSFSKSSDWLPRKEYLHTKWAQFYILYGQVGQDPLPFSSLWVEQSSRVSLVLKNSDLAIIWALLPRRISSVGRALDCRAKGCGLISWGGTMMQGLKITEKWRYTLFTASGETFAWLRWPHKLAVPSPVGEVKIVSPFSTFMLNTLTLK